MWGASSAAAPGLALIAERRRRRAAAYASETRSRTVFLTLKPFLRKSLALSAVSAKPISSRSVRPAWFSVRPVRSRAHASRSGPFFSSTYETSSGSVKPIWPRVAATAAAGSIGAGAGTGTAGAVGRVGRALVGPIAVLAAVVSLAVGGGLLDL